MTFNSDKYFPDYSVKRLTVEDIPALYDFCKENTAYYEYMKSEPTIENLTAELRNTPPDMPLESKHFVGFYAGDKLIAILDLIIGFPNVSTAFIGWFMTSKLLQGTGIGSQIITKLLIMLKDEGYALVRLGCIEDNVQGIGFWRKHGFMSIGESAQDDYAVIVMQRDLLR